MIHITETAAKQFVNLTGNGDNAGFRLSLTQTGCNGYSYKLEPAPIVNSSDHMFQSFEMITSGVVLVVNDADMVKLDGMTVDFIADGFNQRFNFVNSKETGNCGCGGSVSF
jgi:iron-sulfur cluster assembly protein